MKHAQNFIAGFFGTALLTGFFFALLLQGVKNEQQWIVGIVFLVLCLTFGIINTLTERNNP